MTCDTCGGRGHVHGLYNSVEPCPDCDTEPGFGTLPEEDEEREELRREVERKKEEVVTECKEHLAELDALRKRKESLDRMLDRLSAEGGQ